MSALSAFSREVVNRFAQENALILEVRANSSAKPEVHFC